MKSTDNLTLTSLTNKYLNGAVKLVESVFKHEDEIIRTELEASINNKSLVSYNNHCDSDVKSLKYFIVVNNKEKVLGIIGIYTLFEDFEDTDWIGWYCVSKKYRGKGIGIFLLNFVIDLSKDIGKKYLCLYTSTDKSEKKAQKIYEKNGFYITKRVKEDGYEILFRRKDLSLSNI